MHRIKCIIPILQCFAVIALFSAIQPDWDQGQQSKALSCKEPGLAQYLNFIGKSAQHLKVDVVQTSQLSQIAPPLFAPEKVENKDS